MIKRLSQWLLVALLITSAYAQAVTPREIGQPQAPLAAITPLNISPKDIDSVIKDWNSRSARITKMPGFVSATLYRSILPDNPYQLIEVAQWQSYTDWEKAHSQDSQQENSTGFYRPAVAYTHFVSHEGEPAANALLDRVKKDPAISSPEAPFVFINLMQMEQKDVATFIADWKTRSQLTRQQAGSMGATLYKTLLPSSRYPIINISQWQSYNAFIDAQNDATYSRQLEKDLNQASSIKLIRGFFRPVAYQIQTYD